MKNIKDIATEVLESVKNGTLESKYAMDMLDAVEEMATNDLIDSIIEEKKKDDDKCPECGKKKCKCKCKDDDKEEDDTDEDDDDVEDDDNEENEDEVEEKVNDIINHFT